MKLELSQSVEVGGFGRGVIEGGSYGWYHVRFDNDPPNMVRKCRRCDIKPLPLVGLDDLERRVGVVDGLSSGGVSEVGRDEGENEDDNGRASEVGEVAGHDVDNGDDEERGERKEEDLIQLPSQDDVDKSRKELKLQQKVPAFAKLSSWKSETGLPTPAYFNFQRLGSGAKRAVVTAQAAPLDPKLRAALASGPPKLPPPKEVSQKHKQGDKKHATIRPTQTYENDPTLTQDIKMLLMRSYVDPKRFYKNLSSLPKNVQVGTVVAGRQESSGQTLTRRERKKTMVEEILSDAAVRQYSKRKYGEIQQKTQSGGKGWKQRMQEKKRPKWARPVR